jgi:hypothetical protein
MLYNQPYGRPPEVTWGDTPYINGNPATGSPGSIPPAASIEYPQRELVNLIKASTLIPSNADLQQVARALQSGAIWYGVDAGTANAYQATLSPPPLAYYAGMVVVLKIANKNTGPSVLNLNALGPKNVVHFDGSPLGNAELVPGAFEAFVYDGVNFQLAWMQRSPGAPVYLQTNLDYYVNGTTGNDAFDGLTATVGSGIHGPFKTLQHACDQIPLYNQNGYNVTIHVADGTYAPAWIREINGAGFVFLLGNEANPANCKVTGVNSSCFKTASAGGVGLYYFSGFEVSCSGSAPNADAICNFSAYGAATTFVLGEINFGPCVGAHISTQAGALISNYQPTSHWTIKGGASGNPMMNGSFVFAWVSGTFIINSNGGPLVNIPGPISFAGAFVLSAFASNVTFLFGSLTGAGNVTGQRYIVSNNANITTGGAGVNYYPGTIAGVATTFGTYG